MPTSEEELGYLLPLSLVLVEFEGFVTGFAPEGIILDKMVVKSLEFIWVKPGGQTLQVIQVNVTGTEAPSLHGANTITVFPWALLPYFSYNTHLVPPVALTLPQVISL